MSFVPEHLSRNLALRAELTVELLRLREYDSAVAGALPLVGTPYQAWFLHARAWQKWHRGESAGARALLRKALDLLGRGGGLVDFLLVDDKPLIPAEFSAFGPPTPLRARQTVGSPTPSIAMVDSPRQAERLFVYVYPLLPICVSGVWIESPHSDETDTDPWNDLLLASLGDERLRLAMARQLWNLWKQHPYRVAVAANAAFFLMLCHEHARAMKVCDTFLLRRPYISIIRALKIVCLYRLGQRQDALSQGEYLMAHGRRDGEGVGSLLLGMLALEEGAFEVASRFLQESAWRGNFDAAFLDSRIPYV